MKLLLERVHAELKRLGRLGIPFIFIAEIEDNAYSICAFVYDEEDIAFLVLNAVSHLAKKLGFNFVEIMKKMAEIAEDAERKRVYPYKIKIQKEETQ